MNRDLFPQIITALMQNWALLLTVLACLAWGGLVVFALLKRVSDGQLTDGELSALAFGGWPIPSLLLALVVLYLRWWRLDALSSILVPFILLLTSGAAVRSLWGRVKASALLPIAAFLALVFLRIRYVSGAVLPAYFDSAEHYKIMQYLLGQTSAWTPDTYYHLGYHSILAAFVAVTDVDSAQLMLVFGQVVVAALPLPMYFFVRRVSGSTSAAWVGVALAGLGWFVPAHAANWGKYPALLGMLALQFTLGLALLDKRYLAFLSLLFAVRFHTRMVLLMAVCLASAWLARRPRWLVAAGLGVLAVLVWRRQDLGPLWDAYGSSNLGTIVNAYVGLPLGPLWGAYGNLTSLLAGLLAVFAARAFPRLAAGSVLALLAGFFLTLVPPRFPLLDRPLTEMALVLPLAFLGGLGSARLPRWMPFVLAVAVLVHAWANYSFAPSTCCQLAGRDDLAAMEWVQQNTPADAHILIASANYSLGKATLRGAGTDAGIWVTPLTGRVTPALSYSSDFSQEQIRQQLCWGRVSYVYVGSREMSFNADLMLARPDWYRVALSLSKARIFQVLGCDGD